jgi:lantibiotic leader peptide-processing serine protease
MNVPRWLISAACLAATCSFAHAQPKNYLILASGQGKGSTSFASHLNAQVTADLEKYGVVLVSSNDPAFATKAAKVKGVQQVSADPEFKWIHKETRRFASSATPSSLPANKEPFNAYLWNLRQIGADKTSANDIRGKGARVAVLDAGMDLTNPDLTPNIDVNAAISFACYTGAPNNGCESVQPTGTTEEGTFNHGTHVGGIIAAAINGFGVQGVAPEATLIPIKVLRETGSGSFGWILQGIAYAETQNIDIANMSLGLVFLRNPNVDCTTTTRDCNAGTLLAALNRAINHATASGILSVISAGNDGVDLDGQWVSIPAQSGNGMAVAATGPLNQTNFDRLAPYSNYGRSVVDIAAPGGDFTSGKAVDGVLSDGLCNSATHQCAFYFADGTSMAAPHVAGVAALIVGQRGHIGPAQLKSILENTSVDILKPGADVAGKGRVNAVAATQ